MRRGQQSYPLAIGGTLYVTTNDATCSRSTAPPAGCSGSTSRANSAVFKNFGIVANRGLAYCGGRLFIPQLDMKLVALRPSDGRVVGEVAIKQDVPNASANYGYSETSAPICANGRLVIGAAGSEYGIRGFVMAYTTDLKPAWPSAVLDDPARPAVVAPRVADRRRRRGLDAGHDRRDDEHRLLRHRLGNAALLPEPPTRHEPAHELADRGRPAHREAEVVAAAHRSATSGTTTSRSRRSSTTARSAGGRGASSRSRRWRASGSRSTPRTGRPFHERVKVIDRVEHRRCGPGSP